MKKINLGILFGGKSAEHEISLRSAKNIVEAVDTSRHTITLIGIDKTGIWHLCPPDLFETHTGEPDSIDIKNLGNILFLRPGGDDGMNIRLEDNPAETIPLDVVFPILHGTFGEDGTIQGLLKLMNLPFVGAGVTGSAIGMDKDVMKRLLKESNIPIARFLCLHKSEIDSLTYEKAAGILGSVFFIKPVNCGSSVGVNKVTNAQEFKEAVREAFTYDTKIIIEEMIFGREIECSVLGNNDPIASVPGEIILNDMFYTYKAKYIDSDGVTLELPAKLSPGLIEKIKEYAIRTFKVLCCEGMARVDFFLKENNEIIINEINTIPGFTPISMYPQLWELTDISYTQLISELVRLALLRYEEERKIETSFDRKEQP
ncbi:MAG: D-alanine--D-alanine ligase [Spirochaetales bacterium]|nr:D-alanine--D-alanine ligase [Spirochaetales bacterium]